MRQRITSSSLEKLTGSRGTFPLELEIQPGVDAMRRRIERARSQLEHAVVDAQTNRSHQRYLHAAARVHRQAGVGARAQLLLIEAAAGREIRLEAEEGHRRLKEQVPRAGLERRRAGRQFVRRESVFELEAHH